MKKIALTLILLIMSWYSTKAQNLVPNPSFEQYKKLNCETVNSIYYNHQTEDTQKNFDSLLYYWTTPTHDGGVELFSSLIDPTCYKKTTDCANSYCTTNPVSIGTLPKDGNNFCYLELIDLDFKKVSNLRSYLQTPLLNQLTFSTKYLAGLYYKRPTLNNGILACNNLGLLFTQRAIESTVISGPDLLRYDPQVNLTTVTKADTVWKRLFGCFIANGDEQYLTIGNFFPDDETKIELTTTVGQGGYYAAYAIDSVFSEEVKNPFIPNVFTPNGDSLNEKFVIKDIHFGWWSLTVVNRWGKQVFFSNDYRNTWNGGNLDQVFITTNCSTDALKLNTKVMLLF